MRPEVEKPSEILELARNSPVALLVVGDPMQATTHIDLEAHCDEQSIEFSVIPGLSATSLAVSLSGLQSYRFGRQVTLPFAYGDYLRKSNSPASNQNDGQLLQESMITVLEWLSELVSFSIMLIFATIFSGISNSISSIIVEHIGHLQSPLVVIFSSLVSSNKLPVEITESRDLAVIPTPQHCLQINKSTPSTSSLTSMNNSTLRWRVRFTKWNNTQTQRVKLRQKNS